MVELSATDREAFNDDGFLVVDELIAADTIATLQRTFEYLFSRKFEIGVYPDEVNRQEPDGDIDLTRQIFNDWKANRDIARIVPDENYFPILWRADGFRTPQLDAYREQDSNV